MNFELWHIIIIIVQLTHRSYDTCDIVFYKSKKITYLLFKHTRRLRRTKSIFVYSKNIYMGPHGVIYESHFYGRRSSIVVKPHRMGMNKKKERK